MTEHDQCDLPIFYLYKGDDGRMHKTSKELTEKLNRITITKNLVISTEYYPQWPEPDSTSLEDHSRRRACSPLVSQALPT